MTDGLKSRVAGSRARARQESETLPEEGGPNIDPGQEEPEPEETPAPAADEPAEVLSHARSISIPGRIQMGPVREYVVPDPEAVPIQVCLARVMAQVRAVGKDQTHRSATAGTWDFRGIDDVLNAVGPALRDQGVIVLPQLQVINYRDTKTTGGKDTREVSVQVKYVFVGPAGDSLEVTTPGESLDSGDKGTAKAMSVAFRIALIQALALPTSEPDPDSAAYQRESFRDPADDARQELGALCEEKGLDKRRVGAVYAEKYGEPLKTTMNAARVWAFMAWLGQDPEVQLAAAEGPA